MLLSDPAQSDAGRDGLALLLAAHRRGATLDSAFFYHNGAFVALNSAPAEAERAAWARLSEQSGLQLIVCRTALVRSGALPGVALSAPFRLGGLGDWWQAVRRSDRVWRLGQTRHD